MRGPTWLGPYPSDEVNLEGQVVRFRWLRPPATIDDEGLADAAAANPFRLPRLHPGSGFGLYLRSYDQNSIGMKVTREALEAHVVPGRHELPSVGSMEYVAFVDASDGHRRAVPAPIRTRPQIGIHDPRRTIGLIVTPFSLSSAA